MAPMGNSKSGVHVFGSLNVHVVTGFSTSSQQVTSTFDSEKHNQGLVEMLVINVLNSIEDVTIYYQSTPVLHTKHK